MAVKHGQLRATHQGRRHGERFLGGAGAIGRALGVAVRAVTNRTFPQELGVEARGGQHREGRHENPNPRPKQAATLAAPAFPAGRAKPKRERRWLQKPENQGHFRGPENRQRVKTRRKAHPGYWRKGKPQAEGPLQDLCRGQSPHTERVTNGIVPSALQDLCWRQPALVGGLIATLTGSALQGHCRGGPPIAAQGPGHFGHKRDRGTLASVKDRSERLTAGRQSMPEFQTGRFYPVFTPLLTPVAASRAASRQASTASDKELV